MPGSSKGSSRSKSKKTKKTKKTAGGRVKKAAKKGRR